MLAIEFVHEVPWKDVTGVLFVALLLAWWVFRIYRAVTVATRYQKEHPPTPPTIQELADTSDFKFL